MTRSTMTTMLGSEFDAFLFASVDAEDGGERLSVLSALARLDLDPWREAAALAGAPKPAARQRLASLIAALGDAPATRLHPAAITERLIMLLPDSTASQADPAPTGQALVTTILINLLLLAGMMFVQWTLASARSPPAEAPGIAPAGVSAPKTPQPGAPR